MFKCVAQNVLKYVHLIHVFKTAKHNSFHHKLPGVIFGTKHLKTVGCNPIKIQRSCQITVWSNQLKCINSLPGSEGLQHWNLKYGDRIYLRGEIDWINTFIFLLANTTHPHSQHTPAPSWLCHDMETFSTLLALCEENYPRFPVNGAVIRTFDVLTSLSG